jgi:hypothetical protein
MRRKDVDSTYIDSIFKITNKVLRNKDTTSTHICQLGCLMDSIDLDSRIRISKDQFYKVAKKMVDIYGLEYLIIYFTGHDFFDYNNLDYVIYALSKLTTVSYIKSIAKSKFVDDEIIPKLTQLERTNKNDKIKKSI